MALQRGGTSCPRIFHVHRRDFTNIGDMLSSPLLYFPLLRTATKEVFDVKENATNNIRNHRIGKSDMVIIGGGGLLNQNDRWSLHLLQYCQAAGHCIIWSPGFNQHYASEPPRRSEAGLLETAAVVTLRDTPQAFPTRPQTVTTMLDASCLHSGLDQCPVALKDASAELALFSHFWYRTSLPANLTKPPTMLNNIRVPAACKLFAFMCGARAVLTTSYHGSLWATYLNRTALVADNMFSEKFEYMPFKLRRYPSESTAPQLDGFAIRDHCRRQNREFYATHVESRVAAVLACSGVDSKATLDSNTYQRLPRSNSSCEPARASG